MVHSGSSASAFVIAAAEPSARGAFSSNFINMMVSTFGFKRATAAEQLAGSLGLARSQL